MVSVGEVFQKPLAVFAELGRNFSQPDRGLDGFDLTEEWPNVVELVVTPMLEETLGVGRNFPIVGVGEAAPLVNIVAKLVDDGRSRVVLLLLGREPFAFVKNYLLLLRRALAFSGLRNGCDELGAAATVDNPLRRLAVFIELPV